MGGSASSTVRSLYPGLLGFLLSTFVFFVGETVKAVTSLLLPLLPDPYWQTGLHLIYAPLCLLIPPKFTSPESFVVVVTGGSAGKFSAFAPGFGVGRPPRATAHMSRPVSVAVEPAPPALAAVGGGGAGGGSEPCGGEMGAAAYLPTPPPPLTLVDPTGEMDAPPLEPAPRSAGLGGCVALVDISKANGSLFLDRIEGMLSRDRIVTRRYSKATFSRPMSANLRAEIARTCSCAVVALAD